MLKRKPTASSVRTRQPGGKLNQTFRRNNVVISKRQKELADRQQSVSQRQADLKKSLIRKQKKNRLIVLVLIASFSVLVYRLQITGVSISTNASSKLASTQQRQYEEDIHRAFVQSTLFSQSWLLDSPVLSKKIIAQHSEIERIGFSSSAPLSKTLTADVRFRKAIFTWRDASGTEQFVDSKGVLFAKNFDPSVSVSKLIKIEDQSGVVLDEGTSVLTDETVSFIGRLPGKLVAAYGENSKIAKVIIPRSTREVQVNVEGVSYVIKLNSTRDLDDQVGELNSLLRFLKTNNATVAEYIDLRVPHRAFYK